jgi:uncharacterized protein (TIGR03435 family)
MAWRVRDVQVIGGPGWMDSDGFSIAAKADASTTNDQCRVMMQALLKERFKLVVHNEKKFARLCARCGTRRTEVDQEHAGNAARSQFTQMES